MKCLVPAGAETVGEDLLKRFDLEIHSLVHSSDPQIVTIADAGTEGGHPYVVMQ